MKNARWVSFLMALVALGAFLMACTQGNNNGPAPAATTESARSPTPTPDPANPYTGVVDRRNCEMVAGWVYYRKAPATETKVELYIDDKLIETVPAQELRPGLTSVGTGRYGFHFKVPATYKDGKLHQLSVRVAGTSHTLPFLGGGPSTLECKAS